MPHAIVIILQQWMLRRAIQRRLDRVAHQIGLTGVGADGIPRRQKRLTPIGVSRQLVEQGFDEIFASAAILLRGAFKRRFRGARAGDNHPPRRGHGG